TQPHPRRSFARTAAGIHPHRGMRVAVSLFAHTHNQETPMRHTMIRLSGCTVLALLLSTPLLAQTAAPAPLPLGAVHVVAGLHPCEGARCMEVEVTTPETSEITPAA